MRTAYSARVLVVLLALLAYPAVAAAQASITGVVRDASGAVLPGVNVEVSSPVLIEKVRSAVTDGGGQYRVVDLRPGAYSVTFALAGFSTVKRDGVELSGSLTATVNADLRVGGVAETITVTAATPIVDVQSVQQQRVMTKEIIDTLPTGRTTINVAVLIPGMNLSTTFSGEGQDVGGTTGEVQQTLTIHGSRGDDMRRMVDGLSMQSQGTSVSAFAANSGMIQEVTVDTAAGSAEQSAGGVRMNIIPREGGNRFSGSFFATGTNEHLQANNVDQRLTDLKIVTPNAVKSNWEVNPAFGGPIAKDRLWFFASGRAAAVNNYISGAVQNANGAASFAYAPDTSFRGSRDTLWRDINARLTWQATPKNKLSLFVDTADRCSCYDSRQLTTPEASADFVFPWKNLVTITYNSPLSGKLLLEAGFSHKPEDWGYFTHEGREADERLVGVTDQTTGVFYRGPRPYFIQSMRFKAELMDTSWRTALSYVTGRARAEGRLSGPRRQYARQLSDSGRQQPLVHVFQRRSSADLRARPLYLGDPRARRRRLRAGSLDHQAADAQPRRPLGLLPHQLPAADAGTDAVHADAERDVSGRRPGKLQRHHAEDRRRLRPVRQRADGAEGLFGEVRRAADLHRHLWRFCQPGAAHRTVREPVVERSRGPGHQRRFHRAVRSRQPAAERRVRADQQSQLRAADAEHDL